MNDEIKQKIYVNVDIEKLENIKEISSYNDNYYKLPDGIKIKGFNVIHQICEEDYNCSSNRLVLLENNIVLKEDNIDYEISWDYKGNGADDNLIIY